MLPTKAKQPNSPDPRPTEIQGISQREFRAWLSHPVTKLVHGYLADYQKDAEQAAIRGWRNGGIMLETAHELRGRMNAMEEIRTIPLPVIIDFYLETGLKPAGDEEDGAETHPEDPPR